MDAGEISRCNGSKSITCDITPEGGSWKIGSCTINILPKSVSKNHSVKFVLSINSEQSPKDFVQASATLTCEPATLFRKAVHIQLPTWFITQNSVDVSIYIKQTGSDWFELDSVALTDEKMFDIQLKHLDNITAFLQKRSLPNVHFVLKSYFYRCNQTILKTGFGFNDEVLESFIKSTMKNNGYELVFDKMNDIVATVNDEIEYALHASSEVEDKSSAEEFKGQIKINEGFVEEVKGYFNTHDVMSTPIHSRFTIKQIRKMNGGNRVVREESFHVIIQAGKVSTRQTDVEFLGSFRADNVLTDVGDVNIDQTVIVDEGQPGMTKQKNDFAYERTDGLPRNRHNQPGLTISAGGATRHTKIRFLGDVHVKNMIGNAGNVIIDQRRIVKKQQGNDNYCTRTAIQAEGDFTDPMQPDNDDYDDDADDDDISNKSQCEADIESDDKNTQESMVDSQRTFTSSMTREYHE